MGYGQTEMQRDLYDAADAAGAAIVFEATDIELHDITSTTPSVTYRANGVTERIECDFIAGCDGFHGVSRTSIPAAARTEFARDYPFGWLGILSETPPVPVLVVRPARARFRPLLARDPDVEPLLRAGPADRRRRRLARRPVLVRVARPPPRRPGGLDHDRTLGGEVAGAAAQLRLRADAARQPVPRRRRRAHRAPDGRQGPEPRRVRRLVPLPRTRRPLRRRRPPPRRLLRDRRCNGCGARCASRGG